MLKKRLIFVLYYDSGFFFLSRNFRLQKVGDVRWLVDRFRFKSIGRFIDEIVILDVSREVNSTSTGRCNGEKFSDAIAYLMKETFLPLTIGGGLRNKKDAQRCFALGADKILLNTSILSDPHFVRECVSQYGAQAVISAIDCYNDSGAFHTRIVNGQEPGLPLAEHLTLAVSLGVGEIFINSIDKDGTGMGFDMKLINSCLSLKVPLILCGGAGKPNHFAEALALSNVEAVATGNLFNFIGKGFELARNFLLEHKYPVRKAAILKNG